jgi:hypothetical protein
MKAPGLWAAVHVIWVIWFVGCGQAPPSLTTAELMKPDSCKMCHPNHFAQWSGSMHAYAADDPVFRAMNSRGQRETGGALGTFCVNCHAPMAVKLGMTPDGLNLDSLPPELHGVTCFFCHSASAVTADHNNPLTLAGDGVMRGGIPDPVHNTAHNAAYSSLHDRQVQDSSTLCGSCHDIVNGKGVALERTFHEWQGSVYAMNTQAQLRTCAKCHMPGFANTIAANYPGVPVRAETHDHSMAGVDTALGDFPGAADQAAAVASGLLTALSARLCVKPIDNDTGLDVILDNVSVGHGFPSGATQDRRAWVELVAYQGGNVIYSTGKVADDQAVGVVPDPDLWLMRDKILDGGGKETHNFWDAATDVPADAQLAPSVTNNTNDPRYYHSVTRSFKVLGKRPDKVTLRVRIRPIGLEVIDDLVATKDLDAGYRTKIGVLDLGGTVVQWDPTAGYGCVP